MDKVFSLPEIIPVSALHKIPDELRPDKAISAEALVIRLLLGTLKIKHSYSGREFRQNINYAFLPGKSERRQGHTIIKEYLKEFDPSAFQNYIRSNRVNARIYQNFLAELVNFFYHQFLGSHIAGFVYLYRAVEQISYSFPLIYVSLSTSYINSYDSLKKFFSSDTSQELKFFKTFIKTLFEPRILNLSLEFDLQAPDLDMLDTFRNNIKRLCSFEKIPYDDSGPLLAITYEYLFDLLISTRNRYFHFQSSRSDNIPSYNFAAEQFFENINQHFVSWIAYTYFEICRNGIKR